MGDMDMLRGAQWLSGPDFDYGVDSAGYYEPVHRTHVVSRSFRLTAEEAEGLQLTIAVLGYAKLHVNGEPLPRVELLGHWTRWDRAVYTDTFDVTGLVRAGENRISIELGNGFYNPSRLRCSASTICAIAWLRWGLPRCSARFMRAAPPCW